MQEILTLEKLKEMKPDTIITSGVGYIEHPFFNQAKYVRDGGTLEEDGRSTKVNWVAVRGGIYDWAIYHSMDANFILADYLDDSSHLVVEVQRILDLGAKLYDRETIQKLVPCTEEALEKYRD